MRCKLLAASLGRSKTGNGSIGPCRIETHKVRVFPSELSGGEQQRVSIARAIVNTPKVLIADEPTGNLDPENSWEIMKLLDRINAQGTTVVMATHNSTIVNTIRHRVIALKMVGSFATKRKENMVTMIRTFFRHLP